MGMTHETPETPETPIDETGETTPDTLAAAITDLRERARLAHLTAIARAEADRAAAETKAFTLQQHNLTNLLVQKLDLWSDIELDWVDTRRLGWPSGAERPDLPRYPVLPLGEGVYLWHAYMHGHHLLAVGEERRHPVNGAQIIFVGTVSGPADLGAALERIDRDRQAPLPLQGPLVSS